MKPTNSENASVIMLVALLAGLGLTFAVQNPVDPKPPVDNVVVEGEPSMEMRKLVFDISRLTSTDKAMCQQLAAFHSQLAEVIENDNGVVSTTSQFRAWYMDADSLRICGTDLEGSVPGFGAAKDKAISGAIGLELSPLTPAKRKKLVEVLRAIAWSLRSK